MILLTDDPALVVDADGDGPPARRLLGTADGLRRDLGQPRGPSLLAGPLSSCRQAMAVPARQRAGSHDPGDPAAPPLDQIIETALDALHRRGA